MLQCPALRWRYVPTWVFNEGNVLLWIPRGTHLGQTSNYAFKNVITGFPHVTSQAVFLPKTKPVSARCSQLLFFQERKPTPYSGSSLSQTLISTSL